MGALLNNKILPRVFFSAKYRNFDNNDLSFVLNDEGYVLAWGKLKCTLSGHIITRVFLVRPFPAFLLRVASM
jgi:hypothetical protein